MNRLGQYARRDAELGVPIRNYDTLDQEARAQFLADLDQWASQIADELRTHPRIVDVYELNTDLIRDKVASEVTGAILYDFYTEDGQQRVFMEPYTREIMEAYMSRRVEDRIIARWERIA